MSSTAGANVGAPESAAGCLDIGHHGRVHCRCHLVRWPLLVTLEAAVAADLSPQLTASWVWAISVGSGVVCLIFSWITRQPVMVAWSIPGAALLITQLGLYPFSDVIGAYIVCGVVSAILGATAGWASCSPRSPSPSTFLILN